MVQAFDPESLKTTIIPLIRVGQLGTPGARSITGRQYVRLGDVL